MTLTALQSAWKFHGMSLRFSSGWNSEAEFHRRLSPGFSERLAAFPKGFNPSQDSQNCHDSEDVDE